MSDDFHSTLPVGSELSDGATTYQIIDPGNAGEGRGVLGQGGFGITYLAMDQRLQRRVAVKEFFPQSIVGRGHTLTVATHNKELFTALKKYFLEEARNLAKFRNPGIVDVLGFFEQNNTAYMVMPYLAGETLQDRIRQQAYSEADAKSLMLELLNILEAVHAANILHRDVKPSNIKFHETTDKPVLIDFGSARQSEGPGLDQGTRSTFGAFSPNFSPIELNSTNTRKTAATDLYALGATIYRAMFQAGPPDSTERFENESDYLPELDSAEANKKITPEFAGVLRKCLMLRAKERYQSVSELKSVLATASVPPESKPGDDILSHLRYQRLKRAAMAGSAIVAVLTVGYFLSVSPRTVTPPTPVAAAVVTAEQPALPSAEPDDSRANEDDLAWQNVVTAGYTLASLNTYVSQFPKGKREAEAKERISALEEDERAFSEAERTGTQAALNAYLSTFPNGIHATDARQALSAIEAEEIAAQATANMNSSVLACDRAAMWGGMVTFDNPSNVEPVSENILKKNLAEATELCQIAVDAAPTVARSRLLLARTKAIAENYSSAEALLASLVDSEYSPAFAYLGAIYSNKENIKGYDLTVAETWYLKGCERDNGASCSGLAWLYSNNISFLKTDAEQLVLFEKACELGDPTGCASIGTEHLWGENLVNRSADVAISRLKEGCESSESWACSHLAIFF